MNKISWNNYMKIKLELNLRKIRVDNTDDLLHSAREFWEKFGLQTQFAPYSWTSTMIRKSTSSST